jgi:hypothetical protein
VYSPGYIIRGPRGDTSDMKRTMGEGAEPPTFGLGGYWMSYDKALGLLVCG